MWTTYSGPLCLLTLRCTLLHWIALKQSKTNCEHLILRLHQSNLYLHYYLPLSLSFSSLSTAWMEENSYYRCYMYSWPRNTSKPARPEKRCYGAAQMLPSEHGTASVQEDVMEARSGSCRQGVDRYSRHPVVIDRVTTSSCPTCELLASVFHGRRHDARVRYVSLLLVLAQDTREREKSAEVTARRRNVGDRHSCSI